MTQHIKIDADHILHNAERKSSHSLSHLESWFLEEWRKMATFSETEAKKLLTKLAERVG